MFVKGGGEMFVYIFGSICIVFILFVLVVVFNLFVLYKRLLNKYEDMQYIVDRLFSKYYKSK